MCLLGFDEWNNDSLNELRYRNNKDEFAFTI